MPALLLPCMACFIRAIADAHVTFLPVSLPSSSSTTTLDTDVPSSLNSMVVSILHAAIRSVKGSKAAASNRDRFLMVVRGRTLIVESLV